MDEHTGSIPQALSRAQHGLVCACSLHRHAKTAKSRRGRGQQAGSAASFPWRLCRRGSALRRRSAAVGVWSPRPVSSEPSCAGPCPPSHQPPGSLRPEDRAGASGPTRFSPSRRCVAPQCSGSADSSAAMNKERCGDLHSAVREAQHRSLCRTGQTPIPKAGQQRRLPNPVQHGRSDQSLCHR